MGIKATVLDHGSMHCDLTWLLLEPGVTLAGRANPTLPRPWVECPTHTVLIEHSDALILWDTSPPEAWEERWAINGNGEWFPYDTVKPEQLLKNRLRSLGYEPEAIDIVIVSHMHTDHAANLNLVCAGGAKAYCHADELAAAQDFSEPFQGAYIKADYENIDFVTFTDSTEIVPGVTVVPTPGHTPGTCSLRVDLPKSGTMLFTSDSVYRGENWGPPPLGSSIVWDSRQWLDSVEKLRKIATVNDATTVFGHDANQMREFRRRDAWVYE